MLVVEDEMSDVTTYLPGLDEDNYSNYCEELGFRSSWAVREWQVYQLVDPVINQAGLCVESVTSASGGVLISLILSAERKIVCPVRALLLQLSGSQIRVVSSFGDKISACGTEELLTNLYNLMEELLEDTQ